MRTARLKALMCEFSDSNVPMCVHLFWEEKKKQDIHTRNIYIYR